MKVACVLKSGGEFRSEHVVALADSVLKHNSGASIICLTDSDVIHESVEVVPLQHNWPGWWSKIELFRPGVCEGPTLYMDLDTVVVGKIDIQFDRFTMLPDVYRSGDFGSGVMAWRETPHHVYQKFSRNPDKYMAAYRTRNRWGDQAFIRDNLGERPATFGDHFRSYKVHCRHVVPPDTRVVYFHGQPRPWQVQLNG